MDTVSPPWSAIAALPRRTLAELFAADPDRLDRLGVDVAGIRFDFAKTHLTADAVAAFEALARSRDLAGRREALFAGTPVGPGASVAEHTAERGEGSAEGVARARALQGRMRALIDAIEAELFGPVRHLLHLGIGGAALGPRLLVDALGRDTDRYDVAVVATVDGAALEAAFARCDPAATLVVIASHDFAAPGTMLNAASALQWLAEAGVDDPYGRLVAVTAAPEAAVAWGVDETRVLPVAETVDERHSLWSAVGFAAALALGWDSHAELLDGAGEMDRHFRLAALHENAPALAAFADLYYAQARGAETRATFAHDDRLRLLPAYLQGLALGVGQGGGADGSMGPIVWGGTDADARAAAPLLHGGAQLVPVEFVAVIEGGDTLAEEHHRQLLFDAFARGAALMAGGHGGSGDRPSSTILLDRLDARTLGALLAFHEHRAFVAAVLLGIDPFAPELRDDLADAAGGWDPSTADLTRRAELD